MDSKPTNATKILLTEEEAADCLGVSKRTFATLRTTADWLPYPIALGPRLLRWSADELHAAVARMPRYSSDSDLKERNRLASEHARSAIKRGTDTRTKKSQAETKTHASYAPGAMVRVAQICGKPSKGVPGLLPISKVTWWRWVKAGRVPAGRRIGAATTAWPIEEVMALAKDLP